MADKKEEKLKYKNNLQNTMYMLKNHMWKYINTCWKYEKCVEKNTMYNIKRLI